MEKSKETKVETDEGGGGEKGRRKKCEKHRNRKGFRAQGGGDSGMGMPWNKDAPDIQGGEWWEEAGEGG